MRNWKIFFTNRFILLAIFLIGFALFNFFSTGTILPSTNTKDTWFYSGLFMVLFSLLFIEPYFSSPKNVLTNAIPLLLVLIALYNDFTNKTVWVCALVYLITLLLLSVTAMTLDRPQESERSLKNSISNTLRRISVFFGQGRVLYSIVFLYFLLTYYSISEPYAQILLILWSLVVAIDPKKLSNEFWGTAKKKTGDAVGEIFGVQSKRMFLIKVYDDKRDIKKFDIVKFKYSMRDDRQVYQIGIVFDTYLLNQERWAKVLQLSISNEVVGFMKDNVVYKIPRKSNEFDKLMEELSPKSFVGVVGEGSTVTRIRFECAVDQESDIQEGDLLQASIGERTLFYQVTGGFTIKERLENRDETGYIDGEAIQLGEWNSEKLSFQKYGWLPEINTPLFAADTSNIASIKVSHPEYLLGKIPKTTLRSVIDIEKAVGHHMALLGVTGSGKSHLARRLIDMMSDRKTIIVDLTGEWEKELEGDEVVFTSISGSNLDAFLQSDQESIGVVSIASMSNTTEVLVQTQKFLEKTFDYAKKKYSEGSPIKVALILEEAHTIVPEASFLGDNGSFGANKNIVNKMGQISLQGRKYGIGLVIIAQRTANVSKTVLTQCNTVVCFQAFDDTSFTFLSNYIGRDLVSALPNLKPFHAVVMGKGLRSNLPMIVDLYEDKI